MTFEELVKFTCDEVDRPDMTFSSDGGSGEAVRAVLASILTLHQREEYWRDVVTIQTQFDNSAYIQAVDLDLLPRFRKMYYVRKWDNAYQASQLNPQTTPPIDLPSAYALGFMQEITPDAIFDTYGYELTNVWYAAGSSLYIKSNTAFQRALIGYYSYPALVPGTDGKYTGMASWIATNHPWAIIYHAASKIFTSIGQQDVSRKYDSPAGPGSDGGLVQQQIAIIDRNNIVAGR